MRSPVLTFRGKFSLRMSFYIARYRFLHDDTGAPL